MSDTKAPESCPFCGADGISGFMRKRFICETWLPEDGTRTHQTSECATTERKRLTRELESAKAHVDRLQEAVTYAEGRHINQNLVIDQLRERIKRLEEAGDEMVEAYEELGIDSFDKKRIAAWRKAKEAKP